jgi:hypothetical protein
MESFAKSLAALGQAPSAACALHLELSTAWLSLAKLPSNFLRANQYGKKIKLHKS